MLAFFSVAPILGVIVHLGSEAMKGIIAAWIRPKGTEGFVGPKWKWMMQFPMDMRLN